MFAQRKCPVTICWKEKKKEFAADIYRMSCKKSGFLASFGKKKEIWQVHHNGPTWPSWQPLAGGKDWLSSLG